MGPGCTVDGFGQFAVGGRRGRRGSIANSRPRSKSKTLKSTNIKHLNPNRGLLTKKLAAGFTLKASTATTITLEGQKAPNSRPWELLVAGASRILAATSERIGFRV